MDLAVGVMIGAAFGAIVESFIKNLIMPLVAAIVGKPDFSDMFVVLKPGTTAAPYATLDAANKAGATVFGYGAFLTALVNFLIIAGVIFMLVKAVNKMKKPVEEVAAGPTEVELLIQIRDSLKK